MRKYDKIKNKKMRKGRYAMFKRKIYNKMQEWKKDSNGKTALLIEGARRIGKSTVVEEFAKQKYFGSLRKKYSQRSQNALHLQA